MKNILLINAGKTFAHSTGRLNKTLHEVALDTLSAMGRSVKQTVLDDGYNIKDEVEKFVWADAIVYQMPGWWMGAPWTMKKYLDLVFTAGHGKLYASDGRSRSDASKKYGSGGLLHDTRYMLSLTWNAPQEAFDDPDQFFHGVGIDGVYLPFHKANQFLGMKPLETFLCTDVIKMPDVESYIARYRAHLSMVFA